MPPSFPTHKKIQNRHFSLSFSFLLHHIFFSCFYLFFYSPYQPRLISTSMGVCLSAEERESRQRSHEIDKQLEEDNKRLQQECKLLLLGTL